MLDITLLDRLGVPYAVEPHPAYMDYEGRDDPRPDTASRVRIAFENALAPVIASIDGGQANGSVPDLVAGLEMLRTGYPDREDGIRLAEMLIGWARRWPQGRWDISGGPQELAILVTRSLRDHVEMTIDMPRYADEPLELRGMRELAIGEHLDVIGPPEEHLACDDPACSRCNEITERDLRGEHTVTGGGGGGRRAKPRPKTVAERNRARAIDDEPEGYRPAVVSGRVSIEAKGALLKIDAGDGRRIPPGHVLEALGQALLRGVPYAAIVDQLEALATTSAGIYVQVNMESA